MRLRGLCLTSEIQTGWGDYQSPAKTITNSKLNGTPFRVPLFVIPDESE
ncbi:MAG: hypothetical protein IJK60_00515 [Clostridia bacterium]|nr:hypothetical protein [Clostridia bacterium]